MKKKISAGKVKKNLLVALMAQVVSLAVSFVVSMVVPKFISEYQYAYWQMYMLYVGYVGIIHFGILDGMVLRYSQYDYDELDKKTISSQFQFVLAVCSLFALITAGLGMVQNVAETRWIFVLVACGIISKNLFTYTSYVLQITNRIGNYAKVVILQRAANGVIVVCFLIFGVEDFRMYCIADIMADLLGVAVGYFISKEVYSLKKVLPLMEVLQETGKNIAAGIVLMAANWSSIMLNGSAKMIIQWRWDALVFGKVSFAFSISNLLLTFVSAISVVLFPSLKRMDEKELPNLYVSIRQSINPLLFGILILYYPGSWILKLWVPEYTQSLEYLRVLLPIVVFSIKTSLLTNNYLKAYRAEKSMMIINLLSVVAAMAGFVIGAYVINNLYAILICMVLVVMIRSMVSEYAVMKIIERNDSKGFFAECLLTIIFIVSAQLKREWMGIAVYACAMLVYLWSQRNVIGKLLKKD